MGVKFLESFIRRDVPNGFLKVNMLDEIRNSPNKVIVIDVMACFTICNSVPENTLCGGRYTVVLDQVEHFFKVLKDAGAKLVFFKDGAVQEFKYETWTRRQDDRYARALTIFDDIRNHVNISDIGKKHRELPQITTYEITYFAKKYGEFFICMENDCDLESAIYAQANEALAIITDDSDFLIYQGNWKYWSIKFINFDDLTTKEYNRQAFTEHLSLTYEDLPYFATIAGNDVIKEDEVKRFHKKLGYRNQEEKFLKIADYVKKAPKPIDDAVLTRMLGHIFGNDTPSENFSDLLQRFKTSLKSYDLNCKPSTPDDTENIVNDNDEEELVKLLKRDNDVAYKFYNNIVINVSTPYHDHRDKYMGDLFKMATDLYAKMAGIVAFHRQDSSTTFKMYIKKTDVDKGLKYQFVDEEIIFPSNMTVPPLLQLYSADESVNNGLLEIKYSLLCWILSDNLLKLSEHVRSFDKEYVTMALALYFLVEQKAITISEADLLMLALHRGIQKTIPVDLERPKYLEYRAFRLVFMLTNIMQYVGKAFKVVGIKNGKLPFKFDGVYYHHMYNKLLWLNEARKDELFREMAEIQPFRLYSSITDCKEETRSTNKKNLSKNPTTSRKR